MCAHAYLCVYTYVFVSVLYTQVTMYLYAAGQGHSSTKTQEVIDLQVNNEALLCMLERERQHSQRLAEALQQAEANALEVSPLRWVQTPTGSHGSSVYFADTNAPYIQAGGQYRAAHLQLVLQLRCYTQTR